MWCFYIGSRHGSMWNRMESMPCSNRKQMKFPGKCVECFKKIEPDQIICGPCQADLDGEFDHFRQIKEEEE